MDYDGQEVIYIYKYIYIYIYIYILDFLAKLLAVNLLNSGVVI